MVTFICDACGTTDAAGDLLPDAEVVWPALALLGWTGSPFATGPHRCKECPEDGAPQPTSSPPAAAPRTYGASFDQREHEELNAVTIAPLADLDEHAADVLRPALMSQAASGRHVIVDLCAVNVIDPAGLGLLVRAHREARQRGAAVSLAAPSRFVLTVLHTMRLDGVFPRYADRRHALDALRSPSPINLRSTRDLTAASR